MYYFLHFGSTTSKYLKKNAELLLLKILLLSAMANLLHHSQKILIFSFLIVVSVTAAAVSEDCTSHAEAEQGKSAEALKFKMVAIASILIAGGAGVSFPILGQKLAALRPENDVFFMIKAFAGGVVLATGFVHVLPDAFRTLTSPCLGRDPWAKFPFSGFVAMVASMATLMVDTVATSFYKSMSSHETRGHGHEAGFPSHGVSLSDLVVRQRIISQVLELGIVVHSVIIGVSVGASQSPDTIKPLMIALSFHQFFEGMGLGGCISQAKFEPLKTMVMTLFFSLTAPVGIGIGIGISSVYGTKRRSGVAVEGIFNSASAGILIYMALVDLLAADFMSKRMENNVRLQLGAHISLLLGAGSMSFLAMWA